MKQLWILFVGCVAMLHSVTMLVFSIIGIGRFVLRVFMRQPIRQQHQTWIRNIVTHCVLTSVCSMCVAPLAYVLYQTGTSDVQMYFSSAAALIVLYGTIFGVLYWRGEQWRAFVMSYALYWTAPSSIITNIISAIVLSDCAAMLITNLSRQ